MESSKSPEPPPPQIIPERMSANGYMFAQPVREPSIDSNISLDTGEVIQEKNHLNATSVYGNLQEGTSAFLIFLRAEVNQQ